MNSTFITVDDENPKYRTYQRGDDILEYTVGDCEIGIDWVSGRDAAAMLKAIHSFEGEGVTCLCGYVTDKLGSASDQGLQRFGRMIAHQLGSPWKARIEVIEGRRFLVFTKEG